MIDFYMKKSLLIFLQILFFALPGLVLAQSQNPAMPILCRLGTVVGNSATAIILIMWVIVGIMFLASVGSPERFSSARKALVWVIIGTAVCLLAYGGVALIKNTMGISQGGTFNCQ